MHLLVLIVAGCAALRAPETGPPEPPRTLDMLPAETAEAARVQILLSRTKWQPGSIDGQLGSNARHALAAFQEGEGIPATGRPDPETVRALEERAGGRALTKRYKVTPLDVDGPFVKLPEGLYDAHQAPCMCYASAWEELGERFHVAPELLAAMNPDQDMNELAVGDTLVVPDTEPVDAFTDTVAKIRVDVNDLTLTALDAEGGVLRQYPTVVGEEYVGYEGTLTVTGVAHDPEYRLDPKTWEEIPDDWEVVTIPKGPNSPVGVVWMQLSRDGYGIHGTSHPEIIGHTESHGCVRLTNWSALELAEHVEPGVTEVEFVGMGQG
ncbi:MAG: L,D-transpeptidase family protein [Myxococcota bacterium]